MSESMTLYDIETGILDMLQMLEDPDLREEERANIDVEINIYVMNRLAKVDGIASIIREFEARAQVETIEAQRIVVRGARWSKWAERIRDSAIAAMQAAGQKKLEGHHNTLMLRDNPPAVDIRQPELVPGEFRRVTVTMSLDEWLNLAVENGLDLKGYKISVEPNKQLISAELKKPDGAVPGCQLTRKQRLEIK